MSSLNQSGEEISECPLCMEPLEMDDLSFYPCTCGYQVNFAYYIANNTLIVDMSVYYLLLLIFK